MKQIVLTSTLSLLVATVAYALTHPDLKEASNLAEQAIKRVHDAQQTETHGADFGGHANKAITLFEQAQKELNEADKYNDAHQKRPKQ
jgi:hypothetical protein